ncbi:MAG: hypothetical protein J6S67_16395 [Methanobrevibacter sp.]|nr:hypothetical protein [Methanobrevibacter sp.]
MAKWIELTKQELQYELVACMEHLRPAIFKIIGYYDPDDILAFDYYIDTYVDQHIVLLMDGIEFFSANTDNFDNPGEFMSCILDAVSSYYQEEEDEN